MIHIASAPKAPQLKPKVLLVVNTHCLESSMLKNNIKLGTGPNVKMHPEDMFLVLLHKVFVIYAMSSLAATKEKYYLIG